MLALPWLSKLAKFILRLLRSLGWVHLVSSWQPCHEELYKWTVSLLCSSAERPRGESNIVSRILEWEKSSCLTYLTVRTEIFKEIHLFRNKCTSGNKFTSGNMTQSPSPSFGKVWSSITGGLRVVSQTVLLWIAGLTTFWKGGVVMKSETLETRNTEIKLKIKLLRKGEEWGLLMITDLLVHFQHWKRYNIWATVPQLGVHLKAWCFCYTTSVWKFSSIQKRPFTTIVK